MYIRKLDDKTKSDEYDLDDPVLPEDVCSSEEAVDPEEEIEKKAEEEFEKEGEEEQGKLDEAVELDKAGEWHPQLEPLPGRLSPEEQIPYIKRWQEHKDRRALRIILNAYKPVLKKIAKKWEIPGLSFEDHIRIGQGGIAKALATFDPSLDNALWTYAKKSVEWELSNARRHSRRWFKNVPGNAEQPTLESLNAPIGDEETDETFEDRITEGDTFWPEQERWSRADSPENVCRALVRSGVLNDGEAYVVSEHIERRPRQEVAQKLGIGVERVRQIKVRATEKLRRAEPSILIDVKINAIELAYNFERNQLSLNLATATDKELEQAFKRQLAANTKIEAQAKQNGVPQWQLDEQERAAKIAPQRAQRPANSHIWRTVARAEGVEAVEPPGRMAARKHLEADLCFSPELAGAILVGKPVTVPKAETANNLAAHWRKAYDQKYDRKKACKDYLEPSAAWCRRAMQFQDGHRIYMGRLLCHLDNIDELARTANVKGSSSNFSRWSADSEAMRSGKLGAAREATSIVLTGCGSFVDEWGWPRRGTFPRAPKSTKRGAWKHKCHCCESPLNPKKIVDEFGEVELRLGLCPRCGYSHAKQRHPARRAIGDDYSESGPLGPRQMAASAVRHIPITNELRQKYESYMNDRQARKPGKPVPKERIKRHWIDWPPTLEAAE